MLMNDDYTYDDMNFENFEFSSNEYDTSQREPKPFTPPNFGNYPPEYSPNTFPPKFDSDYSPNFNYPGGGVFNPPGMPKSPPPNYVPNKNDSGVQNMNPGGVGGAKTFAVSANSIRFCLYKYTYIWEVSGSSYWAFLLNINNRTVSGFRWFRRTWVYFGLDLRRINSFICYRGDYGDYCNNCLDLNRSDNSSLEIEKEQSLNAYPSVYTQTLASIDIPNIKEDCLNEAIYSLENTNRENELHNIDLENIGYRITLEVTCPNNYDENFKNKINELATEAGRDVFNILSDTRQDIETQSDQETFNSSLELIPEMLKTFHESFSDKLKSSDQTAEYLNDISFSIRNEKIHNNWKPYFYNDSVF